MIGNKCYRLWVNGFYGVVTIKMKFNLKYNWIVSFMETTNKRHQQEKQHIIQLDYTNIFSK